MSDYFTFQTTNISIRYRLLQTYNKSYKIISKLANLLQLLGSIMSRMYKHYLMLIANIVALESTDTDCHKIPPIICCFQLLIQ